MKKNSSLAHSIANTNHTAQEAYTAFLRIDGSHPWKTAVPEAFIDYQVRVLPKGEIAYFNFDLAKEMGLIAEDHPHEMNASLKAVLLDCFNLCIINEYDLANNIRYPKASVKPNTYMATRYLQLQHPNKQGKTSGDGRSIWNGTVKHKGRVWDISSRGTGVTALAPGVIEAGRYLKTGSTDYGYGCGLAEIDELYATAIMSEIFHRQGIETERSLLVIETSPGMGIGVRASQNLLRPAHLFALMKQGNYSALRRAMDYFIARQIQNGRFQPAKNSRATDRKLLQHIVRSYAEFAAKLESEYIFAWFDWDGDNMLMDVGILDYGSIRQFGLRHDEYRYDDITRYSTNLNEQKLKSRRIVQTFCQIFDFLATQKKRPLKDFARDPLLNKFDQYFTQSLRDSFTEKLGLNAKHKFSRRQQKLHQQLFANYGQIESFKCSSQIEEVADGINKPPYFNPRKLLRICIEQYHEQGVLDIEQILSLTHSQYSERASVQRHKQARQLIRDFCQSYVNFFTSLKLGKAKQKACIARAELRNHPDRITGNSITFIVEEILHLRKRSLSGDALQKFIDLLVYNLVKKIDPSATPPPIDSKIPQNVLKKALYIVREHSEEI